MNCSRQRENCIETAEQLCVGAAKRNGERNKILGADFVTRSNYFVTSDRRDWAPVVLVYHYEMLLAAADFDSIVRQHGLHHPTRSSKGSPGIARAMCAPGTLLRSG